MTTTGSGSVCERDGGIRGKSSSAAQSCHREKPTGANRELVKRQNSGPCDSRKLSHYHTTPKTTAWAVFDGTGEMLLSTIRNTTDQSIKKLEEFANVDWEFAKDRLGYSCRKVTITVNKEKK